MTSYPDSEELLVDDDGEVCAEQVDANVSTSSWSVGDTLTGRYRPVGYIVELPLLVENGSLEELLAAIPQSEQNWINRKSKALGG